MTNWIHKAKFYHIYPLGFLGAPQYHQEEINHRLHKIIDWIPHMKSRLKSCMSKESEA